MIVTLCGHRDVEENEKVASWVYSVAEQLILDGASVFYLGGYGKFDEIAKYALNKLKKKYVKIQIVLVLAYLNRSADMGGYSYTLYPPIENVPKRFAVLRRNQWMVEQSDVVVAYVTHGWGGASKTLAHARIKKKRVVLFSA